MREDSKLVVDSDYHKHEGQVDLIMTKGSNAVILWTKQDLVIEQ